MKQVKSSVTLLDVMGSDLSVVNAARASFDKQSVQINNNDTKLIRYLATHGHWTPFAHCFASFRIEMPIFVARQLMKHQVGLSWNEVSRRYVDFEPSFIMMPTWRERAKDKKQGSKDQSVLELKLAHEIADRAYENALQSYVDLLNLGVCPEQARSVLPLGMMTTVIWSGSLYAFARVCNLRMASDTQKETRDIANGISGHLKPVFPISWPTLVKYAKDNNEIV